MAQADIIIADDRLLPKAVDLYNHKRPHDSLNYLTPNQAHQLTGIIKRNWKNYNKNLCNT